MVLSNPAEVVNLGATATGRTQPLRLPRREPARSDERPRAVEQRQTAFFDGTIPVYRWDALKAGMVLDSPCIVEADDSTIFIPAGCESRIDEHGNVLTTIVAEKNPAAAELDPFTAEVIRGYLISTVEEMVRSTTAVAYSSTFADRLDFTCGIFDADGRLVAQAKGVPSHAGTMMDSMLAIIEAFRGDFKDGDAIVLNDVYAGGSHQPDVMVARPIFHGERLIGFAANRGHWTDVGGMAAGGFGGTARHVVQEALTIPPAKLYEGGVLNQAVRAFILKNVRIPHQIWGDLQSQVVANVTADVRLKDLIAKYGLELVTEGMQAALEYGRRRFRQRLLSMPDGTGTASDPLDTDGVTDRMYRLVVTVEKKGDRLSIDCTGTSEQALAVINCSEVGSKGHLYVGALAVVDPDGSINSGVADLIDLVLPPGTIVNPRYPAPVSAGWYGMATLTDCVIRGFGEWLPERAAASSHGDRDNTTFSGYRADTGAEWLSTRGITVEAAPGPGRTASPSAPTWPRTAG
jgi:N-methylhydantoinase B